MSNLIQLINLISVFSYFVLFKGAIVEMDQRVCQAEKDLNLMRYQREMKQQELERLKWELNHLNDIQQVSQEDIETEEVQTIG